MQLLADLTSPGPDDLRTGLLTAGAGRAPLLLDGTLVERADFACFQILCAAFRDADKAGAPLGWSAASPFIRTMAQRLGINAVLHLDPEPLP